MNKVITRHSISLHCLPATHVGQLTVDQLTVGDMTFGETMCNLFSPRLLLHSKKQEIDQHLVREQRYETS